MPDDIEREPASRPPRGETEPPQHCYAISGGGEICVSYSTPAISYEDMISTEQVILGDPRQITAPEQLRASMKLRSIHRGREMSEMTVISDPYQNEDGGLVVLTEMDLPGLGVSQAEMHLADKGVVPYIFADGPVYNQVNQVIDVTEDDSPIQIPSTDT